MSRPIPPPPALARYLVAAVIRDARWRDVALGDLAEEFDAFAKDAGARRARRWYWRQAVALACHTLGQHLISFVQPAGGSIVTTLIREARVAWRALARRPLATLVVLVTLALGLGANAATFGMIDAIVLRPYPTLDVNRLVMLSEDVIGEPGFYAQGSVSPPNFAEWRQNGSNVFTHVAAFTSWDVNLAGGREPERLPGARVSAEFFDTLHVHAAHGRTLGADDEIWGRHHQVVIGDGLWRRDFGADPAIVGRTIDLDGEPSVIVGVAPRGFDFQYGAEVWAPLALAPGDARDRAAHYLTVIAELRQGKTIDDARAEMAVVYRHQRDASPDATRGRDLQVQSFVDGMDDPGDKRAFALQQTAALIVLLVGCANIASLLVARAADRRQELALRLAIGASRAQIVRQLLVESVLVACAAVPAALAAAVAIMRFVHAGIPAAVLRFVPGVDRLTLDGRVVAFTVLAALAASVLFGLAPALAASRVNPGVTLKAGGRAAASGGASSHAWLRGALVVAEVALVLPLLVVSMFAGVAGERFASGPQGFNPHGLVQLRTALSEPRYSTAASERQFGDRLLDDVRRMPGVTRAAITSILPSSQSNETRGVTIDGVPDERGAPREANYRVVSAEYFETMQIPIDRGRGLAASDRDGTQPVAVVSESFARAFLGGGPAIGRRIRLHGDHGWLTIVGISGDIVDDWLLQRGAPTVFVPFAQAPTGAINVVARAQGDPAPLASDLRRALAAVDSTQPAFGAMTMDEAIRERTSGLRTIADVLAGFGVVALVLAAFGLYGVMANVVAERRYEIGVRMALGATAADVGRHVLGQGGRLTALGVAIGLVASLAVSRLIEHALFGVVALNPWLIALAAVAVTVVTLAAALSPACRAMRTEPAVALKGE